MDGNLTATMLAQGGVFDVVQAAGSGCNGFDLQRATQAGELVAVRRGIYTTREHLDSLDATGCHALELAAALLARGVVLDTSPERARFVGGHRTAGLLWGLPRASPPVVGRAPDGAAAPEAAAPNVARADAPNAGDARKQIRFVRRQVELISANRSQRTYRAGVHVRPAALPPAHLSRVCGLPVTSRARTAIDLVREGRWLDGVIVADGALRAGVTAVELRAIADYCACWRGGRLALRVAEFADGRSESPAESLARCVFADLGLPPPELQVALGDDRGFIGRVDFLFRVQRTIVEIDGREKYENPHGAHADVVWKEKVREDRLREAGWEVVRVTWRELAHSPAEVGARIRSAFARAGRAVG